MKKDHLKIKEQISFQDKVNAIEYIANSYFTENEKGELVYTPYLTEIAQTEAIITYFLEGISFDADEDIYGISLTDSELNGFVSRFYPSMDGDFNELNRDCQDLLRFVLSCTGDKVAYLKQAALAKLQQNQTVLLADKLMEVLEKEARQLETAIQNQENEQNVLKKYEEWLDYQNQVAKQFSPEENAELTRKMADLNFDPAAVSDLLADKYVNSGLPEQQQVFAEEQEA